MEHDDPMRTKGKGQHRCPVCEVFMPDFDTGAVPTVVVEQCPRCEGMLVSEEQLDQLDESMWVDVGDLPCESVTTDRELACPRCRGRMHTFRWRGDEIFVELDWCGDCRMFWLDKGELDKVRALVEARSREELDGMLDTMDYIRSPAKQANTPIEKAIAMRPARAQFRGLIDWFFKG